VQVSPDQEIVELGVFQGRTALMLAWGARQGHGAHVTAIDAWDLPGNDYGPPFTDPGSHAWAKHNVMALGYNDRIRLVRDFAVDAAAGWEGPPVGLLFVDDDHSYAGARNAIEGWAPHLAPGAVIAVDDYGHEDWPGVKEAVDALVEEGFLAPVQIFHDALAVTRLTRTLENHRHQVPELTAITSEGVSPSPSVVSDDSERHLHLVAPLIEGGTVPIGEAQTIALSSDNVVSIDLTRVSRIEAMTIDGATIGSIDELNIAQLKALAKARGIVLGARKDKRALILQALADGK
jgi:hypothetical protein